MTNVQLVPATQNDGEERSIPDAGDFSRRLYLDDLQVGQRFQSHWYLIEAEEIKRFASHFDPQPFHLDEEAARKSFFGGLAASGWHTGAVAMKLLAEDGYPLADGIIGLGAEIFWPRPTRPGDFLRLESEVVEICPSKSKPNQAVVVIEITMLNQNSESVFNARAKLLAFGRDCRVARPTDRDLASPIAVSI